MIVGSAKPVHTQAMTGYKLGEEKDFLRVKENYIWRCSILESEKMKLSVFELHQVI